MTEDQFSDLIMKHVTKESSAAEEILLQNEISQDPRRRKELELQQQLWSGIRINESLNSQRSAYKSIQSKIRKPKGKRVELIVKYSMRAAAVILFLVISILVYRTESLLQNKETVAEVKYITNKTLKRQRSTVGLPDGSIAWLNANSEIKYKEQFDSNIREIELKGEAIFQVMHNPEKPFVVRSRYGNVKVLGTTFSVNSSMEEKIEIALLEGSVMYSYDGYQYKMNSGELLTGDVNISGKFTFSHEEANIEDLMVWRDNVLLIKDEGIENICLKLEKWYGIDIELLGAQDIGHLKYHGRFENESLNTVLESIKYTRDFQYEINGDSVKIQFYD